MTTRACGLQSRRATNAHKQTTQHMYKLVPLTGIASARVQRLRELMDIASLNRFMEGNQLDVMQRLYVFSCFFGRGIAAWQRGATNRLGEHARRLWRLAHSRCAASARGRMCGNIACTGDPPCERLAHTWSTLYARFSMPRRPDVEARGIHIGSRQVASCSHTIHHRSIDMPQQATSLDSQRVLWLPVPKSWR